MNKNELNDSGIGGISPPAEKGMGRGTTFTHKSIPDADIGACLSEGAFKMIPARR
jgi:hypothetical protein